MLQESDSRVAPTILTKPYTVGIKEECVARSSASVIDLFDAGEQKASAQRFKPKPGTVAGHSLFNSQARARDTVDQSC
jgi:hypothetical protein